MRLAERRLQQVGVSRERAVVAGRDQRAIEFQQAQAQPAPLRRGARRSPDTAARSRACRGSRSRTSPFQPAASSFRNASRSCLERRAAAHAAKATAPSRSSPRSRFLTCWRSPLLAAAISSSQLREAQPGAERARHAEHPVAGPRSEAHAGPAPERLLVHRLQVHALGAERRRAPPTARCGRRSSRASASQSPLWTFAQAASRPRARCTNAPARSEPSSSDSVTHCGSPLPNALHQQLSQAWVRNGVPASCASRSQASTSEPSSRCVRTVCFVGDPISSARSAARPAAP